MIQIITKSDQIFSNYENTFSYRERRNDDLFRESAGSGNSAAPEACQIVVVSANDFFDEAELTHALEIPRQFGCGQIRKKRLQVRAANATDVELRTLQGA